MPALAPYIPNRDSQLDLWLTNFSSLITANPPLYGLMSSDATNIAAAVAAWSAAYALVTSPSTKTAATVSAKNTERVTVLAIVRPYAQQISLNPAVASTDKVAVGVNPRTSTPSPITPPSSSPVLLLQAATPGSIILRFRDSAASPSVKAKPYGVTQCRLYGMSSATPITDPTKLPLLATPTKSPFLVNTLGMAIGQQVYFAAQWAIRTGGLSNFSPILSVTNVGS